MSDPPSGGEVDRPGSPPPDREASSEPGPLSRLDPDRAAPRPAEPGAPDAQPADGPSAAPSEHRTPAPVLDTRRYRWMIGIFGLVLVIVISIYQFATHGVGTTGVPAGQRLHNFAVPLGNTNLIGDPNLNPPCRLADHDPRALNICIDLKRAPLVLALFVTGSSECERSVDALQTLSRRYPAGSVRFAAVAIHASRSATDKLIRAHHWTVPVAYDRDGSVGGLYGVAICPMFELAYRGGIVKDRLIGDRWQTAAALAPRVQALVRSRPPQS